MNVYEMMHRLAEIVRERKMRGISAQTNSTNNFAAHIEGDFTAEDLVAIGDAMAWVKIKPGCAMPNHDERVVIAVPYKFGGDPTIVSADYNADNLWFSDDDGFWYAAQFVTHWRRMGLPK